LLECRAHIVVADGEGGRCAKHDGRKKQQLRSHGLSQSLVRNDCAGPTGYGCLSARDDADRRGRRGALKRRLQRSQVNATVCNSQMMGAIASIGMTIIAMPPA
jgi:hypothetical protein